MITRKQILDKIGEKHLRLYQGDGYNYFIYDDEENNIYESESIMVMRLNWMSLEQWIDAGRAFISRVNDIHDKKE